MQLATRVADGFRSPQRIGQFGDLVIAEFPIPGTALPGRTVRDSHLREMTGLNVVAVWERGRLLPAGPDTLLSEHSVPIVLGTEEQLTELDALISHDWNLEAIHRAGADFALSHGRWPYNGAALGAGSRRARIRPDGQGEPT